MEKTQGEKLKENLFDSKKIGWENLSNDKIRSIFNFNNEYISFLNVCKTERECAEFSEKILKENGFVNIEAKKSLKPGDKVYYINRKKAVYMAVIGSAMLEEGLNIIYFITRF